jgi:hypothetical protein
MDWTIDNHDGATRLSKAGILCMFEIVKEVLGYPKTFAI